MTNPYPNPYPGAYLFSVPGVAEASLPFAATTAFIRRGIGAGAVDRCISTDTPVRFMYTNQLAGSRPPLPYPGLGPVPPDTLTPGMDNMLMSTVCLDERERHRAAMTPAERFAAGLPFASALAPESPMQFLASSGLWAPQ
jgi:hypothetical protein